MNRILIALAVGFASAALFADGTSARYAFETNMLSCCKGGTYMRHYSHVDDAVRYDKAAGTTNYLFVLSQEGTSRARFLHGKIASGTFVSGQMIEFGRTPRYVRTEEFELLRNTEAMVAIRLDGSKRPYATLYPARSFEGPHPYGYRNSLRTESPAATMVGALPKAGGYAVRDWNLRYFVFGCSTTYIGEDGLTVELGETSTLQSIQVATILTKVREALTAKYPARAGTISDRDVMDWVLKCKVTYTPVKSFYGSW